MPVSTTKDREDPYICNGSVVDFAFSPRIFTKFDLQVWLTDDLGETLLAYGTHYEVIDTAADGFKSGTTVQTVIAYPTGSTITIVRVLDYISEYDPQETGALSIEVLEAAIDRGVLLCQQLAVKSGQSIALPILEQASMELPSVFARAEKFMFFGADGSVTVKGLAELGAVTADESTIVLSASTLSIKDGGVSLAKLAQEVTDLMDSKVSDHNSAATPHSGKFAAANHTHAFAEYGMILSNNEIDPNNDIDISPGALIDSTHAVYGRLSTGLTKQIDVGWVAGDNAGGFPSSLNLSADTWYHVFAIYNPITETTDVGFDTSLTAINLLSDATGFTKFRRLGSVLTDGSANIIQFFQIGVYFYWKTAILDSSVQNPGTFENLRTLTIPIGMNIIPIYSAAIRLTGVGTDSFYIVTGPDQVDVAPSASLYDLEPIDNGAMSTSKHIMSNLSSQIRTRLATSNSSTWEEITTFGWIDITI